MKHKIVMAAFLCFSIVGCGGESSQDSNTNNPTEPEQQYALIETRHSVESAGVDSTTTIDLSSYIRSEDTNELELVSLSPLSGHNLCEVLDTEGLTYSIETDVAQVCRFEYVVKTTQEDMVGDAHGVSEVTVSDTQTERVATIGKSVIQSEKLTLNMDLYLPDGALLDSDSLELRGATESGELGTASAEGNVITYVAPNDTSGTVQLYYTAVDVNTNILYSGLIYIAISLDGNTAPNADQNVEMSDRYLSDGFTFLIDVDGYISDPDGDELQLIDVYAHGNGWAVVNNMSTSFNYTPDFSGLHNISYVVTDKRGGYAIGTLIINIDSYRNIYDNANNKEFLPTLTFDEIIAMDGAYSGTNGEDGVKGFPGVYPTFDRELANAYCVTKGAILPTTSELLALFSGELEGKPVWSTEYKWPSGAYYITTDGSVSLFDGDTNSSVQAGYLSCLVADFSPAEYNFSKEYYSTEWDEPVSIVASAASGDSLYPLEEESYDLEVEILETFPEGLESQVEFHVYYNQIIFTQSGDQEVSTIRARVTDPSVQGEIDETEVIVGVAECPSDVSIQDTQTLGCIPVIYIEGYSSAFTGALSDNIFLRLGIDVNSDERPSFYRSSDTYPNYTYLDPEVVFDIKTSDYNLSSNSSIHRSICNLYNKAHVGGRTNWVMYRASSYDDILANDFDQWEGTVASRLTTWMTDETGLPSSMVGQGYLKSYIPDDALRQHNQYFNQNQGVYQGGAPYRSELEWQFLTCYSFSPN